jgi:hypothetical protein
MQKRNQYVHAELSDHTRLPDVYFDGYFPLYGGGTSGQLSQYIQRAYLTPSKQDVLRSVKEAEEFDTFLRQQLRRDAKQELERFLDLPQIGFNTRRRMYSVPFAPSPFQFFVAPVFDGDNK